MQFRKRTLTCETAFHRTHCILRNTVLVPTRVRPGSALPSLCVSLLWYGCVVSGPRNSTLGEGVGGLNLHCHAPRSGAVWLVLVREHNTTMIQSVVLNAWICASRTRDLGEWLGRLMNPTLGCKDNQVVGHLTLCLQSSLVHSTFNRTDMHTSNRKVNSTTDAPTWIVRTGRIQTGQILFGEQAFVLDVCTQFAQ